MCSLIAFEYFELNFLKKSMGKNKQKKNNKPYNYVQQSLSRAQSCVLYLLVASVRFIKQKGNN